MCSSADIFLDFHFHIFEHIQISRMFILEKQNNTKSIVISREAENWIFRVTFFPPVPSQVLARAGSQASLLFESGLTLVLPIIFHFIYVSRRFQFGVL